MRRPLAWALILGGLASCGYDYDALRGRPQGGSGGVRGSGGSLGPTETDGDGTGTGGSGSGGASTPGSGGSGGSNSGGAAPTGGAIGSGGAGADARGSGGAMRVGSGGNGGAGAHGGGGQSGGGPGSGGDAGRGGAGGKAGEAGSGGGGGQADADPVLWYRFDDGAGTIAADSSVTAGGPRDAMLTTVGSGGAVAFTIAHQVGTYAISLTGNGTTGGGVVVIPSLADLAPQAVTIAAWVYVTASQRWQRVFDLGNSTADTFALTTQNLTDNPRFLIRRGGVEQIISGTGVLSIGTWHHLAVVLSAGSPYLGVLYVDGAQVGTNSALTVHPGDLGPTVNNSLGKSQFAADPYFSGAIDDFRVYRRALSSSEITALFRTR
jgi:hypothetical protein